MEDRTEHVARRPGGRRTCRPVHWAGLASATVACLPRLPDHHRGRAGGRHGERGLLPDVRHGCLAMPERLRPPAGTAAMSEQPSDVETEAGRRTIARFLMADNAKCFSGDDLLQYLQAERP